MFSIKHLREFVYNAGVLGLLSQAGFRNIIPGLAVAIVIQILDYEQDRRDRAKFKEMFGGMLQGSMEFEEEEQDVAVEEKPTDEPK